tara:strand:+ start:39 stop:299 length:261 start_codon:yes stop_codon:yes gene_type:complete
MKKGPFKMKLNSPTKHNKRNQNIFKPDAKTVKPIDLHGDGSKNAGMGMLTPLGNFMPTRNRMAMQEIKPFSNFGKVATSANSRKRR